MKHFCAKKGLESAVCVRGWICAISLPKRGLYPCMGTEMLLQIRSAIPAKSFAPMQKNTFKYPGPLVTYM